MTRYLIGGAALAAVLASGFGFWQKSRADRLDAEVAAQATTIRTLNDTNASYTLLIKQQNEAIVESAKRRAEGQTVYLRDFARADAQAQSHNDRAAELMALQGEFTDELAECRAAKLLLQKELVE